jgi:lycopene beta-cyclase
MYDMILIGGGLANGLIAWWMTRMHPECRLLLVEKEAVLGGNHTWSFYQDDLTAAQLNLLDPMIASHWEGYEVRFPEQQRLLGTHCYSISSERFRNVLMASLKDSILLNAEVGKIGRTHATINGRRHEARVIIDGRGHVPSAHIQYAYQKFIGQEVELPSPHGQTLPIIMDATVSQDNGYRFVYTLPISEKRILVEDTYYSLTPDLDSQAVRQNLESYIAGRGWPAGRTVREESGVLPIALSGSIEKFWDDERHGMPCSGLRAGLFHATTGYSLLFAARLAERLAGLPVLDAETVYRCIRAYSVQEWRRQAFMRLLNRMLFFASPAPSRYRLLQRFYKLPQSLIEHFYAARLTGFDQLRILTGKSPVPLLPAFRAAMNNIPRHHLTRTEKELSSKPS